METVSLEFEKYKINVCEFILYCVILKKLLAISSLKYNNQV